MSSTFGVIYMVNKIMSLLHTKITMQSEYAGETLSYLSCGTVNEADIQTATVYEEGKYKCHQHLV